MGTGRIELLGYHLTFSDGFTDRCQEQSPYSLAEVVGLEPTGQCYLTYGLANRCNRRSATPPKTGGEYRYRTDQEILARHLCAPAHSPKIWHS